MFSVAAFGLPGSGQLGYLCVMMMLYPLGTDAAKPSRGEEEGNGRINVPKVCAPPPSRLSGWVGEYMDLWGSFDWWVLMSGRY